VHIYRIENEYRKANTYIIDAGCEDVLLIDLGGPSLQSLLKWLDNHKKKVSALFLTHEHADHCIGLLESASLGSFNIYCTQYCGENLSNPRRNYSIYTSEIPNLDRVFEFEELSDGHKLLINGVTIEVLFTPGHSPGCACYMVNDTYVFTGDTLLSNKTLLNLPNSNRIDHKLSQDYLSSLLSETHLVFPGHGDSFYFSGFPR
jgi:hydroxyacylglutathione hydrolase